MPCAYRQRAAGFVEKYLSLYTPKVLIQMPNGTPSYWANTRGIAAAREAALAQCAQKSGAPCKVVMENFDLMPPVAPSAREPAQR
jgi:type IV pilus biogenesis protein CpaD/CtpE